MLPFTLYKSREFAAPQPVEVHVNIIPTNTGPKRLTPIVILPIGDLVAGDVVEVTTASCQVTCETTYNMMIGSQLIMTQAPRTTPAFSQDLFGTWVEITEAVTQNIDRDVHHLPINRTGRFIVPEGGWPNAHLILLVYAASDAWVSGYVAVNPDYGRLEGAVHRAVTPAELAEFLASTSAPAPPAPAPEPPPPAPAPEPELITLQITPAQALTLQEVAALIPQE